MISSTLGRSAARDPALAESHHKIAQQIQALGLQNLSANITIPFGLYSQSCNSRGSGVLR
ncbi:MAG: hypothetical protein ACTHK7_22990 [Aureliella sp.]